MKELQGIGASEGIAIGRLGWMESGEDTVEKKGITDVAGELSRLDAAREETIRQLQSIYVDALKKLPEKDSMIFQIHIMMMQDEDFTEAMRQAVRTEKVCAEYAVWEAGRTFSERFAKMDNEYMRGRAQDVVDISRQLIRVLQRKEEKSDFSSAEPRIVAADNLTPSETVQMDKSAVLAFVTRQGSRTAHAAILARTLGIPAVVGLGAGLDALREGAALIVDGSTGRVLVNPDGKTVAVYREKQREEREHRKKLLKLLHAPAVSRGGVRIRVYANIAHPNDVESALENGAEGIGLFRSEFLYMGRDSLPTEEEQFQAYKQVLQKMGKKPVIVRTFDIGADKEVPYLHLPKEANPALGYRAIRICLDRKELFRTQLRALLRASAFGNLQIMFPMIVSPDEVKAAKAVLEDVKSALSAEHIAFAPKIPTGIMVETPSAAVLSGELAEIVDFFSVGTNDLTQYTLAVDRTNAAVSKLYNPRSPAVLKMIEIAAQSAHRAGIPIGICGESAADPQLTGFYLKAKIDELSVAPASILKLKENVCRS